jgi:hypothetical protein
MRRVIGLRLSFIGREIVWTSREALRVDRVHLRTGVFGIEHRGARFGGNLGSGYSFHEA